MRKQGQKFYGDQATTGRQETTTARKRRKARERRTPDCKVETCPEPQMAEGFCPEHLTAWRAYAG